MESFKGQQLDINFSQNEVGDFGGFANAEERQEIARDYKRFNPEEFIKKDGQIYHIDSITSAEEPVEKWFEMEERLNDNSKDWYK